MNILNPEHLKNVNALQILEEIFSVEHCDEGGGGGGDDDDGGPGPCRDKEKKKKKKDLDP